MTEQIQNAIGKKQVLKYHSPVAHNIKELINAWEMDICSISQSGMLYEFEVKISRKDYLKDKAKTDGSGQSKAMVYQTRPEKSPNYFSYVCPDGLISLNEIGKGTGLYYYKDGKLREIQKPQRIHKYVHDRLKILEKVSRVFSERHFLGCCRLTYENNERTKNYFKNQDNGI